MRLLRYNDQGQLCLSEDFTQDVPPYAILSHTWGPDHQEVSQKDIKSGALNITNKDGYAKIRFCGEQAKRDNLSYFWVDTCCIDQKSSSEVSEAINSMFRWYQNAAKCYVFLADVTTGKRDHEDQEISWLPAFRRSRWFRRGWTLQELLAPNAVQFFSRDGKFLGDRASLRHEIHDITQISITALNGVSLTSFPVTERLKWAKNRNTKKSEDKYYCLLGLFDVHIPVLYGEGEEASRRLMDEIGSKFRRQLDNAHNVTQACDSFTVVQADRVDAHDNLPGSPEASFKHQERLLASLEFEQIDARLSSIKRAQRKTCGWSTTHPIYTAWMNARLPQSQASFIRVSGKPGAGKSTLMKFAFETAQKSCRERETVISFFFNARGDDLEKSTTGMFRALLHQIFTKLPHLQTTVLSASKVRSLHDWTIDSLQELFSDVIASLSGHCLRCFIDALDECDERQIRDMVRYFESLVEDAQEHGFELYICFASRPYPSISIRYGQELVLQYEQGHRQDMVNYIDHHLLAGNGTTIKDLKDAILQKAEGIFMWVVLVIPILNKEYDRGRVFAMQKKLKDIPEDLHNLFKHIITRDKELMPEFLLCLQWILFARKPLKPQKFYYAMISGSEEREEMLTPWDSEQIPLETISRYISSSSKGLAELTKSKTATVQFIHESVRDFLLQADGLTDLWPALKGDAHSQSHGQLMKCCISSYMCTRVAQLVSDEIPKQQLTSQAKERAINISAQFPFLHYAVENMLYHANEAARIDPQREFLQNFDLEAWIHVHNLLAIYERRRYRSSPDLLYLFAEYGCDILIRQIQYCSQEFIRDDQNYNYPFFAALSNKYRGAVRALLERHDIHIPEASLREWNLGVERRAAIMVSPLLWAIQHDHTVLAEALIMHSGTRLLDQAVPVANSHGRSKYMNAIHEAEVLYITQPARATWRWYNLSSPRASMSMRLIINKQHRFSMQL